MPEIVIIPIATIIVFVVFAVVGLMLCIKQRRKNQQVYVARHNFVMPIQPTNPQQFQMPMHATQPNQGQPNTHHMGNSMPTPQPFPTTSPMPVPQPFLPTSPTPDPTSSPDPPTQNLMDRMRQVQTLMVEIHRLESEGNTQRAHELKQRIVELSNTDEHDPLQMPPDLFPESRQPPPAYLPPDNGKIEGPGRDVTR